MLQNKKISIFIMIVFSACYIFGNQFVVKKKGGPSRATLKEECCDCVGDILIELTKLIKQIAELQIMYMQQLRNALRGDADTVFACNNKQQLQVLNTKLKQFKNYLDVANGAFSEHISFLRSLEKKPFSS